MIRTMLRNDWPLLLLLFAPAIYGLAIYNQLPDQVAVHFNVEGEADGTASKPFAVIGMPLIGLAIYLLLIFLPQIDPRKQNYPLFSGAYRTIRWGVIVFLALMHTFILLKAKGLDLDIAYIVPPAVCILFMVYGNVFSTVRPNWFVGFRTPWTIENEQVWKRTHRLSGRLWFFMSFIALILCLLLPRFSPYIIIGLVIVLVGVPFIYSYIMFRKLKETGNEKG